MFEERGAMSRQSTEDSQGSETSLYDAITVKTCHHKAVRTHRVKPKLTLGFGDSDVSAQARQWGQVRCSTGDVDSGGPVHVSGQATYEESMYHLVYSAVNLKYAKNEVYLKNK